MIINLTQHSATPEQREAGVVDLPPELAARVRQLLTFEEPPVGYGELVERAQEIARIARQFAESHGLVEPDEQLLEALIGGAPWFARVLEDVLFQHWIRPVYSFSKRVVIEEPLADGTVRKVSVFKHECFVQGYPSANL